MLVKFIGLVMLLLLPGAASPLPAQSRPAEHPPLQLTQEEKAFLAEHPTVSIGIMADWPPITYVDTRGQRQGIDIAYVKLLNQRLNGLLTMTFGPFKENLEKVKVRQLDALMDVTPNPEREVFLTFTATYMDIPHVIVAPKNKAFYASEKDLSGKTVALEKGFGNVKYFSEKYPDVIIREYPDTRKAIDAVARGEADAYAGNRAVAIYLLETEMITNLKTHGRLNKPGSILAIGVRKDWPQLASILDKALASLSSEETLSITGRWIGTDYKSGIPWKEYGKVIVPIVAVLLIVIIAVFLWNRSLRRVIRERERIQEELK
jgi:ABC-type amino acid transport substrate-binding protein